VNEKKSKIIERTRVKKKQKAFKNKEQENKEQELRN